MEAEDPNDSELIIHATLLMSLCPRDPGGLHHARFDVLKAWLGPTRFPFSSFFTLIGIRRGQGIHIQGGSSECLVRPEEIHDSVVARECDAEEFNEQTVHSALHSSAPPVVPAMSCESSSLLGVVVLVSQAKDPCVSLQSLDDFYMALPFDPQASRSLNNVPHLMLRRPNEPRLRSDKELDAVEDQSSLHHTLLIKIASLPSPSIPKHWKLRALLSKLVHVLHKSNALGLTSLRVSSSLSSREPSSP